MTDPVRLPDPAPLLARLPRGSGVILRDYGHPDREARARNLARRCRRLGLELLVAGDAALALRVGAAGVHLPEHLVRRMAGCGCWRRPRPDFRITAAAHGEAALAAAVRLGVDAVLLSPVFATASHPEGPSLGPLRFAALVSGTRLPVYALGGLSPRRAGRLRPLALAGFAGISRIVA